MMEGKRMMKAVGLNIGSTSVLFCRLISEKKLLRFVIFYRVLFLFQVSLVFQIKIVSSEVILCIFLVI